MEKRNSSWFEYIERFNDGDYEILDAFGGDVDLFIEILTKKKLVGLLEVPEQDTSYQNRILLALLKHDKKKFSKEIQKILSDTAYEGGKLYLVIDDLGELTRIFCENRNSLSEKTIESILMGEVDDYYNYGDTTDNIYRDVIEELTPQNMERLKKRIVYELKDIEISPDTELLELIADEQDHSEYLLVDENNVARILDDEESTMIILRDTDMRSDLFGVHLSAYNNAYHDMVYNEIIGELEPFFNIKELQRVNRPITKWKYNPTGTTKETVVVEKLFVEIINFEHYLLDYLTNNKMDESGISYYGNYLNALYDVVRDTGECPKVYPPDYPDSTDVDRNINDYFTDYF
jgi:hypothetical protein